MKTLKICLKNSVARFAKDETGNFGIMMSVTLTALIGCLACSVDMTNAYANRIRLQNTVDQIALMAAKDQLQTLPELQAAAENYFTLNYPDASGDRIVLNSITRDGDTVIVDASNTVDTYFAGIFGKNTLDVGVKSSATYAQRNVDIALVLDTTGSMAGSKLASLKTAATNLVDELEAAQNDKLNIAVVPFAQYVNVGLSREDAIWLDAPDDETRTQCWNQAIPGTGTCTPYQGTCSNDSGTYSCQRWSCTGREYQRVCGNFDYEWKGCVGSRQTPWHERVAYDGRKIPGLLQRSTQGRRCGAEIQPLTNNMNSVRSTINALNATGYTYIPSGLAWGWRALDTNEPLTEATVDPVGETDKALILMTDGANTRSKSGETHHVQNGVQANNLTRSMCRDIKDGDITVYTIAYELDDAATKTMLRQCASDNAKYFDATDSAQLEAAFADIANSLNELRLTN